MIANYINCLIGIVKFQLQDDVAARDVLLDQLRNLRSQLDSYALTSKKYEKIHPESVLWSEIQIAREKAREQFAKNTNSKEKIAALKELIIICFLSICPPPRVSILRLLEWEKTLIKQGHGHWVIDLTDLRNSATRHKTHKRKGAMILPIASLCFPYLNELRSLTSPNASGSAVFTSSNGANFMDSTAFSNFVKRSFSKYTTENKAPNPSLLRSIFTTWLYGLKYDTEDSFLAQVKASSAVWKAHSEIIASTVYNREIVYQKEQFSHLLKFCEAYSNRFSYDVPQHVMVEKPEEAEHKVKKQKTNN
jgi:hypothetical protein